VEHRHCIVWSKAWHIQHAPRVAGRHVFWHRRVGTRPIKSSVALAIEGLSNGIAMGLGLTVSSEVGPIQFPHYHQQYKQSRGDESLGGTAGEWRRGRAARAGGPALPARGRRGLGL